MTKILTGKDDFLGDEIHDKRVTNLDEIEALYSQSKKVVPHEFNPPATPTSIERSHPQFNRMMSFPGISERKRVRTESLCSNKSTAITKDLQKIRRLDDLGGKNSSRAPNRAEILKKDKAHLTMKDMIYYNPSNNPMSRPEKSSERRDSIVKQESVKQEEPRPKTPEPPKPTNVPFVPQLKLGPNGEMILDEQSLVVQSNAEKEAQRILQSSEVVYEDKDNGRYGFFKRQKRTKDWSPDETIKFYRCLHTVGTDFSLMLQLFPNRTRRELKIKFKKEERNNCHLIDKAILYPKEFDIEALQKELEEEEEERRLREEEMRNQVLKDEQMRKEFAKKRSEEFKVIKNTTPQRWIPKARRSLTEVDAVYEAVDLGMRPKRKPKRRKPPTQIEPQLIREEKQRDETEDEIESTPLKSSSIKLEKPELTDANLDQSYSQESDLFSESETEVKIESTATEPLIPRIEPELIEARKEPETVEPRIPDVQRIQLEPDDPNPSSNESEASEREVERGDVHLDDIDLDSLVLCTVADPKGGVTYQVFMQDPNTGELGDQPLDLDQDIIDVLINNLGEK